MSHHRRPPFAPPSGMMGRDIRRAQQVHARSRRKPAKSYAEREAGQRAALVITIGIWVVILLGLGLRLLYVWLTMN